MKMLPRRWRLRTMMGLVLVVAVGIKAWQKSQEVTVAQRLLSFEVQLAGADPRKLFTEQELVTALGDRSPAVRYSACWALVEIGSTSPALVRALAGLLETESEQALWEGRRDPQQIDLVGALKRIKAPAATLAPLLDQAMGSKDRWVRLCATEVLADAAGRSRPTDQGAARLLLHALRDEEARIRMRAAEAVAGLDPATRRQAVAILLGQFRNAEPPRAFEAVLGLARFDPEAKEVVTILTDRLKKSEAADQLANLYLLGKLGPLARPAVPAVLRAMMSRDADRFQPGFLNRFCIAYNGMHDAWRSWVVDNYFRLGGLAQPPSNVRDLGAAVLGCMGPEAEREAVDRLTRMLQNDDESQLSAAVAALRALGPAAAPALPALTALATREVSERRVEDHDALMRGIAESLDRAGQGSNDQVVETLVGMLKSRDRQKRFWAASTLNQHKPPPRSAVPALIDAMRDPTQGVRFAAAQALGRYDGPEGAAALPALLAAMNDDDCWVRGNAGKSLAGHGAAARAAIPVVVRLLVSRNASLRNQAVETLGEFGPVAAEAIPALLEALDDEVELVRDAAGKALTQVAPVTSATATPAEALAGLSHCDASHRRRTACNLVQPGAAADTAAMVQALREVLGDSDPTVRATAAAALGHLGRKAGVATPALCAALGDDAAGVCVAAATALGRVAPGDMNAIKALAELMKGPCADIRCAAAAALGRMGPAGAPALIEAIDDTCVSMRIQVIIALGQIGPAGGITLPPLLAAAHDASPGIRSWAFWALGRIGSNPGSDPVIPALTRGLDDEDDEVRGAAGWGLGQIRPPGRALPALLGVLDRGSARARARAAYAVGSLGPAALPASLPALVRALKDDNDEVRSAAASAFWILGKASAPAAPALRAALHDPCQGVRNDASGALMLIEERMQR